MSISNAISTIRRGSPVDFDPEDFRQSGRVRRLRAVLASMGVPEAQADINHTEEEGCAVYEKRGGVVLRGYCSYKCRRPPLPEWVTVDLMKAAYNVSQEFYRAKVEANR